MSDAGQQIDLRSDTVTRPTPAMRRAMAEAEVGDDVLDGDPTTRLLQETVAALLGKERALFFPSGTMANQTAISLLAPRGSEMLVDRHAHVVDWELAACAALSGVQPRVVDAGAGGVMDAATLTAAIRPASPFLPRAPLLALENTHNGAGGRVLQPAEMRALVQVARDHDMRVHLDGARLWNAHVATGVALDELAGGADTVMVSFSKGLGAPAGAALAGSAELIAEAWVVRKRFGGAMRQNGILSAAALHGMEHHMSRLADDHANARRFARAVDGAGGASCVQPDTNIVMVDLPEGWSSQALVERAARDGVLLGTWSARRVRAVMHGDVSRGDVERAAELVAGALC